MDNERQGFRDRQIENGEDKEEREKRAWSKTAHIVVLDFLSAEWVRED